MSRNAATGPPREAARPRHAAAVILVRNPLDPEIYWVRRQPYLAFLGGFHSFPGGRMGKEDDVSFLGLPDFVSEAERLDVSLRFCALRELHEETGVTLGDPIAPGLSFVDAVHSGSKKSLWLDDLVPAGRWVTPPFSPARFDTTFYLLWAPDGVEPVVHDGELADGEWVRPEAALDQWSRGKALLAPPALYAVRGLAAAALEAAGNDRPLGLEDAARHMMGTPEASGGPVTRIEMRPGVFLVPLLTRTLPPATHTNAFLVGGASMILVDPGSDDPAEIEKLLDFIDRLAGEGRSVREIWLTHHHPDHVGGVKAVSERLGVPVLAHPLTAERLGGLGVPIAPTLVDGYAVDLPGHPGWRLEVVHTPGHAVGHCAFFESVSGTLLAGDLVSGVGYILIDPPEGDMAAYLASLERLAGLAATVLFPSHGPPTGGVARTLAGFRAHRLEREAKVSAALADGEARSIDQLLPSVYDDVAPEMHGLARRSLLAHLVKLEREGQVVRRDESWRRLGRDGGR